MAVLGSGTSNGGCSLLHAAGLGYGASLALDLPVKVRLLDKEPRRELDDPDDLLGHVMTSWSKMQEIQFLKGICIGRLLQAYLLDKD